MTKKDITTSIEEEAILQRLTDAELSACVKIATMAEAQALRVIVTLLIAQGKNILIMLPMGDPVKIALKHAHETGRILGVESLLRILVNAKHELERRNKRKKV